VSQQVIRTEGIIGRPLFARVSGGLTPLAGAEPFFRGLHDGFRALDGAIDIIKERNRCRLTVSVAPVFAAKWLVPRLGRFHSSHPDIQLLIDATVALADLDGSDVDIAIRVGTGPWRGLRAEPLIEQEVFPVCSPMIAERLRHPSDLASVPVVHDANSVLSWDLWLAPLGLSETTLGLGPSYSDAALCLDAAISGQGVFLAWQTLAADSIGEGRLIRPFPMAVRTGQSYWDVTVAWLISTLAGSINAIKSDAAGVDMISSAATFAEARSRHSTMSIQAPSARRQRRRATKPT
jgi:LysR family transcriptional regulator, glycine cleavage system transcriptional activator